MIRRHWRTVAWVVGSLLVVFSLALGLQNQRDIAHESKVRAEKLVLEARVRAEKLADQARDTINRTCEVAKDTRRVVGGILGLVASNTHQNPNLNQPAVSEFVVRSREILASNEICDLAAKYNTGGFKK